ncbi:hypothetical protein BHM03_00040426, partial [Ensete ventricosum]
CSPSSTASYSLYFDPSPQSSSSLSSPAPSSPPPAPPPCPSVRVRRRAPACPSPSPTSPAGTWRSPQLVTSEAPAYRGGACAPGNCWQIESPGGPRSSTTAARECRSHRHPPWAAIGNLRRRRACCNRRGSRKLSESMGRAWLWFLLQPWHAPSSGSRLRRGLDSQN